jgi:broad specificity phosphatase PhoE
VLLEKMEARVHLVRHAESVHNIDKDFTRLDPDLTLAGAQQAKDLGRLFPYSNKVGLIITSPLRRAIQTTLEAFANILDEQYFDETSGKGIQEGVKLLLDPDIQERSSLPCDTGSDRRALQTIFPNLDFSNLHAEWQLKEGLFSADQKAVDDRAKRVRHHLVEQIAALKDSERTDIVIVTHGVFMKHLSGDFEIDLPKAGWKSYAIEEDEVGIVVLKSV